MMSVYHNRLATSRGIQLKNVETFKRDWIILNVMFEGEIENYVRLNFHETEPFVYVYGDENNATMEPEIVEWGEWAERLPPDDWTDEQKAAHAETFDYLPYYRKFCDPNNDDSVNLFGFFQHHMVEGTYAVIDSVSYEHDSLWYFTAAFTPDQVVWIDLERAEKILAKELGFTK